MPIKKSAIKAAKQAQARTLRNVAKKRTLKKTIKETLKADQLPKAQSVIDKIAKTGYIHKNKASRIKSRLAKNVKTQGK
ncbi:MAG: 30S ribosomal protein S20 [candidate division WS2 bacterium ADurb.Bin280]|uniref:Small ribosomal subunit protein bS20 n=1 Tax=candidate division WS2 bacterium ADurb.Bin280 TaxID=1852829 RepID=A0A1V5SD59_9BACT|nr:MAG: 30S ribosomal protein S20 [candidate division WS2 bacterium ADurb.Bin280]